jgi:hypothetical protein
MSKSQVPQLSNSIAIGPPGYFWLPVYSFPGGRWPGRGCWHQVIAYQHPPHCPRKWCILGVRVCLN